MDGARLVMRGVSALKLAVGVRRVHVTKMPDSLALEVMCTRKAPDDVGKGGVGATEFFYYRNGSRYTLFDAAVPDESAVEVDEGWHPRFLVAVPAEPVRTRYWLRTTCEFDDPDAASARDVLRCVMGVR